MINDDIDDADIDDMMIEIDDVMMTMETHYIPTILRPSCSADE